MPSGLSSYDLRRSIAARWRAELVGHRNEPRSHWQTKVAYYRAVSETLTNNPAQSVSWRTVIAAVKPRGSHSTFYEVAGPHAKHALIDAYRRDSGPDALQIALSYRRHRAIEQLIDEAKVWSFWEYREAYLRTYAHADELPADAYIVALESWAELHPFLAASLDHAPPASTVEDLAMLHRGGLAALWAHRHLAEVLRTATSGPTGGPEVIGADHTCDHNARGESGGRWLTTRGAAR